MYSQKIMCMYAMRTFFYKVTLHCHANTLLTTSKLCQWRLFRVVRARSYGMETCSPCCANSHYCVAELQVLIFGRVYVAAAKYSRSSQEHLRPESCPQIMSWLLVVLRDICLLLFSTPAITALQLLQTVISTNRAIGITPSKKFPLPTAHTQISH